MLTGVSGDYHELMTADLKEMIIGTLTPLAPIPTDMEPSGTLDRKPRAVLFDVYGTLLVSGTGDISLASLQNDSFGIDGILERSGHPVLLPEAAAEAVPPLLEKAIRRKHDEYRSRGADYPEVEIREIWNEVLEKLWKKGILERAPSGPETDVEVLAMLHELSVNPVWPMPGFPDIFDGLRSGGIRTGIVSNAQFYTPLILEALTGRTLGEIGFEADLCSWSFRLLRAKPSAQMFRDPLEALQRGGISPAETLYVGNDMLNDVTTARQSGCMTVLFAGDRRSLRLRESDARVTGQPDAVVTYLYQLTTLISGGTLNG